MCDTSRGRMLTTSRTRRTFIQSCVALAGVGLLSGCGSISPWPSTPSRPRRIGFLSVVVPTSPVPPNVVAWRQQLAELGWAEGQNLTIEYRFANGDQARLPDLAAELVQAGVDVIFTTSTPEA